MLGWQQFDRVFLTGVHQVRATTSYLIAGVIVMFLASGAVTASAQGRVTGLKISNSSVVGTDLSFDVTLYTTAPEDSTRTGFLGNHYHTSSASTSTYVYLHVFKLQLQLQYL